MKAWGLTASQVETSIRSATTGCADFTIAPPATGGPVYYASDFGVSTNNSGGLNYTNFLTAIAYCKSHNAYTLLVPPGTYHVGEYGKYYSGGIFDLTGMTNFIFDGQGSTFLMESKSYFVHVANCSRVAIQNITIGWNWALENVQSVATVNAIDPQGNYIDLLYPFESNPSTNAPIPSDLIEVDSANYNFMRQGLGVIGMWQMSSSKPTKVSANILRFYDNTNVVGQGWFTHNNNTQVGQYYLIRHYEYNFHGFETTTSDNLTFSNLTVYSTLGMGFHFHENQYCQIINSRLIREPGSVYHLSGSADGINVGNSFGHFRVQNVEIGNTGDDAINIHDTLSQGVKAYDTHTLIVSNVINWQNPFHPQDTIELRAKDFSTLSPAWSSQLTGVSAYDGTHDIVYLTNAATLPAGLDVNSIVFNNHYHSDNYIVSDNYIHNNKVRGLVVHNGNGTIENNQFIHNYDPGLFLVCVATNYYEGCNPANVIIRGNVFNENDIKRNDFKNLPNEVVIAAQTPPGLVSYPMCRNIIFENNLVRNIPYAALQISSATNVLADNNTFEAPNQMNDLSIPGCVIVQNASQIVMNNNHLILDAGVTAYKTNIYNDPVTAITDVYLDPFVVNTLPNLWTTWDVGGVGLSGSAAYTNASYTIKGSGTDIWGLQDSFQFVFQPWSGDGQIVARVTGVQNTSAWAKGALMFRETLDDDSRNAIICLTPTSGVSMQSRTNTAALTATVNTNTGSAPTWLLLRRVGNALFGYKSADSINWTFVGATNLPMATNGYVGLAVTSKANTVLNTATFDHVTVSGAWTNQDIGSVVPAGSSQINYSNGVATVSGSGVDIWGTADSFQFLRQSFTGDGMIMARVTGVQGTSDWAKAALMMRETLSADSRNTIIFLTPSNVVSLQGRTATAGLTATISNINNLTPPQWLKLVRSGSNINAYQSKDKTNWLWVGTQTNSMATNYYVGLAVTSKTNNILNTSTFDNITVQSAWSSGDIGNVAVGGTAGIDDATGTFTISGGGVDIWGTNDAFQFVDQPLHGNGQIVAQVLSVENTADWAKAGVMIRDSEAPNSINALLYISPTQGLSFQGRTTTGGLTSSYSGVNWVAAPYWLKLVRSGSTLTAYYSSNGSGWTQVGAPQTIAMSTNAWIGLAVSSKNDSLLNTSSFNNVTVTPLP